MRKFSASTQFFLNLLSFHRGGNCPTEPPVTCDLSLVTRLKVRGRDNADKFKSELKFGTEG